jgi:crotonobetainyl-CoA:carnitine CoA-transferase CaiB-like acyl-CoA transferase
MAAVLGRDVTGEGDWIDVSIMETFTSSIDRRAVSLTAYEYTGEKMVRLASVQGMSVPPPYNPCADGYFHITVGTVWWETFVRAVNEPFIREERFAPPLTDVLAREEFDTYWIPWCMARTKAEIVRMFQAAGLPCAPVNSIADIVRDPQLAARGFFREVVHPEVGAAQYSGLPYVMHDTPGDYWKAAPRLGEDNEEILGDLGYEGSDLGTLAGAGVI